MTPSSAQAGFGDDLDGFEADDDFAFVTSPGPSPLSTALGATLGAPASASGTPSLSSFDDDLDHAFGAEDSFVHEESFPRDLAAVDATALAPAQNPVAALIATAEEALGEAAVPRITIHVFCQQPDTTAIAEQMGQDRRLARATTLVRAGGLAEALELYQSQPTPSLILVESADPAPVLLAGLDKLAEVCDPGTKVVVIGAHNDIALYRELMRRGVSEYLVPPLQVLQLIRAVTTLYADPSTPFVGRTLAFLGARGGVGSSTLAHNVAHVIAEQMQASTVIIDYDLPFGTAGLDFNQDPIQGIADALLKPDRLDPVLLDRMTARCSERLSLFAAPASLDEDYDISAEAYEEVLSKIRTTAPYVVLDLPHLWSGWMRKTLLSADDVVIVATPDLASLRNSKNIIDLVKKARPNDTPPQLVLNQVGVPGRPEIPVKDFAKALGQDPALCLPFDPKLFGQASNNGQMVQEVNAKSKSSEGLAQFAQQLSRREAPVQKQKSLIERLVKRS